ncbi:MAG TPA: glycosyltransferase family 39 protein, partial [Geobacteraceae bacterium]|nr:glycosyltransferase family 39 protein [Geobacteraceae bacterium]
MKQLMESTTDVNSKWQLEWLVILAVGTVLATWKYTAPGLSMDGVTYMQIVRNLQMGEGLGWQALWASPGYSLLIACVSGLLDSKDLLRVVSLVGPVIYLALLLLVYFFSKSLFGRRTALIAGILAAVSPHLLTVTFAPEPELLYTCLQLGGLFILFTALQRRSSAWALLAGVVFALTWLSRSEGLLVMLFTLAAILIIERGRWREARIVHICLLAILAFMLTAAPYLLFLRKHYGTLVLSPKASYVMIWMKMGYGDTKKEELHNDELWGLAPDGRLNWQVPKGTGDLIAYLAADPAKTAKTYLSNLSFELPGRIPNNSGMERYPQLFPIYLAVAAAVGAVAGGSREDRRSKALLLSPLLMLFVLPIFTQGWWKYLLPYFPLLLILAARGIVAGADRFAGTVPVMKGRGALSVLTVLTMLIAGRFLWPQLPASATPGMPTISSRQQIADAQIKAGEWARNTFGRGHRYSMPWSKLVYYLDGYWVASPMADYSAQLSYLWRHRAEYVVTELTGKEVLEDMSSQVPPPPGMEMAGAYQSPDIAYKAV